MKKKYDKALLLVSPKNVEEGHFPLFDPPGPGGHNRWSLFSRILSVYLTSLRLSQNTKKLTLQHHMGLDGSLKSLG